MADLNRGTTIGGKKIIHQGIADQHSHHVDNIIDIGSAAYTDTGKNGGLYADTISGKHYSDLEEIFIDTTGENSLDSLIVNDDPKDNNDVVNINYLESLSNNYNTSPFINLTIIGYLNKEIKYTIHNDFEFTIDRLDVMIDGRNYIIDESKFNIINIEPRYKNKRIFIHLSYDESNDSWNYEFNNEKKDNTETLIYIGTIITNEDGLDNINFIDDDQRVGFEHYLIDNNNKPHSLITADSNGKIDDKYYPSNHSAKTTVNGPYELLVGRIHLYEVTNYNSFSGYYTTITDGHSYMDGDVIQVKAPDSIKNNDIVLSITRDSYTVDYTLSMTEGYDQILLDGPDPVESDKTYEYTITNYHPHVLYSVSSDLGEVTLKDDKVILETPKENTEHDSITITITDGWVQTDHTVEYLYDDIILDGPDPVRSNNTYEYTITNYDSDQTYQVSSNIGNVSVNNDKVILDTPDNYTKDQELIISIDDGRIFSEHKVDYLYERIILDGPESIFPGGTYEYKIDNYFPNKNYSATTDIGSVSITDDVLTLDLSNRQNLGTVNITVTDGDVISNYGSIDTDYSFEIQPLDYDEILLDGPDPVESNNRYEYTITNYVPFRNYSVSSSHGTATIEDNKVILDTPNNNDTEQDLTISINDGDVYSDHTVTYLYDRIILDGPDPIQMGGVYTYTITNYVSDKNYTATTDKGSVSISGNQLTLDISGVDSTGVANVTISDGRISTDYSYTIEDQPISLDGNLYVGDGSTLRRYNNNDIRNSIWSYSGHSSTIHNIALDSSGNSYTASSDQTVKKIDRAGNEVWTYTGYLEVVYGVDVDSNGNVYTAGGSNQFPYDRTVRKLNSSGQMLWKYEGHSQRVWDVAVAPNDNNSIYSCSGSGEVIKIDSNANQQWTSNITRSGSGLCIKVDYSGNVYVGESGNRLVKFDSGGNRNWYVDTGGATRDIAIDTNNNIYVATSNDSNAIIKFNSNGGEIWRYESSSSKYSVTVNSDTNTVYCGDDNSVITIIDSNGQATDYSYDSYSTIRAMEVYQG